MGPALIREEIDDSVVLTPGDMFHHIVSFRDGYTLSSLCTRNTQHCHPTLKMAAISFP